MSEEEKVGGVKLHAQQSGFHFIIEKGWNVSKAIAQPNLRVEGN